MICDQLRKRYFHKSNKYQLLTKEQTFCELKNKYQILLNKLKRFLKRLNEISPLALVKKRTNSLEGIEIFFLFTSFFWSDIGN